MQTPQDAPEPSPAPTLASDFPGFFPKTPLEDPDQEHSSTSSYLDALKPGEHTAETLQSAGKALLGAAAGFVVGGPIGAAVGGGLFGLREVEREGLRKRSGTPTPTNSRPGTAKANEPEKDVKEDVVDEAHRPEFDDQLEKEKHALAESPAQKLVGGDEEEGARLTGEGAIGGALLAGAAGAKVEENEVRSPSTEDDELERKGGVEPKDVAVPPTPDFGTPSIEKEQAALAASPAQQLLRQDTSSSSVTQAESALLAGAAGAKLADREVDEPSKAPIDKVAEKSAEAGAPLGLPEKTDDEAEEETQAHAVPLEREISSPPSPSTLHPTSLDLSRPDLGPSHRPSSSSFAAAVLAAGEGVHTPTETGAAQFGGFGAGGREIRASDVAEDEDEKEVLNSSHPSPSPPSASTFLSSSATAPSHPVEHGTVQPVETNDQTSDAHQGEPKREEKEEEVVHNPAPLLPAALAGTAAGASLLGPEQVSSAPQDFEPYSAPVVEQSAEAKVAAAIPLPETPGLETAPTKSFAPAILGSGGIYPNSPLTHNANTAALSSTDTIPATINAQNYVAPAAAAPGAAAGVVAGEEVVGGKETDGARSPEEEIPLKEALEEGPDSSAAVVPAPVATTTAGTVETIPLEPVEPVEVEEKKDKGKGKGREVVEDVALVGAGAGAGVLAGETLRREDGPTHPAASTAFTQTPPPPALTTQPTSATLDSVLGTSTPHDPSLATSPLDDQRAFPPIPHFNRPSALNSTDEPILDPSVDGASSSHKALDPKVLAASSPATSPEQAGFTNVPKDGALTGAMQDFAHLSQPSKVAEEKALAETATTEPVETVEKREYEEGTGMGGLPLAAGAAGLAAGGAGAAVLAHDHANPSAATTAPPVGAGEQALPAGAVATPIVAATATQQQQPVSQVVQPTPVAAQQPVATPVSRFTEQTNATPTRNAAVSGYDTPSSTRAVKGTPAASTTPDSSVFRDGAATPTPASGGSTTLPPAAAAAGVSPSELANVSLLEAGVIEQSKHMKIQTTRNEEGHKRLHRKSLSGSQFAPSNRRSSLSKATPIAPAQQQEQYYTQAQQPREVQVAPSGVTGADGAVVQNRPGLQTIHSEREEIRRDRMLDDIVGVRDPTYAAVPSTSSYQPRLSSSSNNTASTTSTGAPLIPMRTSTPPVAPSAHANANVHPHNTIVNPHNLGSVVAPASPTGSTGVGRKLSKRRPLGAEGEVKKEGFFSRLLHGGSGGHERRSSVGSRHSPAGSPRTSVEQSRI